MKESCNFIVIGGRSFHLDDIKGVLTSGFNINEQDKDGNTLAHICASHGDSTALKLVVDAGVDLMIKNKKDIQALGIANAIFKAFPSDHNKLMVNIIVHKMVTDKVNKEMRFLKKQGV